MLIGAVADVHGNFEALAAAMARHDDVPLWMCVGDLASGNGHYPSVPAPLYWIKGNNEDFDRVAEWGARRAVAWQSASASRTARPRWWVRFVSPALGGTFAPTWYDTPADRLPSARRATTNGGISCATK